jgi:hypothetical protein
VNAGTTLRRTIIFSAYRIGPLAARVDPILGHAKPQKALSSWARWLWHVDVMSDKLELVIHWHGGDHTLELQEE